MEEGMVEKFRRGLTVRLSGNMLCGVLRKLFCLLQSCTREAAQERCPFFDTPLQSLLRDFQQGSFTRRVTRKLHTGRHHVLLAPGTAENMCTLQKADKVAL
jgi:hypothetical protein